MLASVQVPFAFAPTNADWTQTSCNEPTTINERIKVCMVNYDTIVFYERPFCYGLAWLESLFP